MQAPAPTVQLLAELCPYEYSYTSEVHLNVTEKLSKVRTQVPCGQRSV